MKLIQCWFTSILSSFNRIGNWIRKNRGRPTAQTMPEYSWNKKAGVIWGRIVDEEIMWTAERGSWSDCCSNLARILLRLKTDTQYLGQLAVSSTGSGGVNGIELCGSKREIRAVLLQLFPSLLKYFWRQQITHKDQWVECRWSWSVPAAASLLPVLCSKHCSLGRQERREERA